MEGAQSPPFAPRRRRPLAIPLLAMVLGIVLARAWGPKAFLFALACLPAMAWVGRRGRRDLVLLCLCVLGAFLVGVARMRAHRAAPPSSSLARVPKGLPIPVRLCARVIHMPPSLHREDKEAVTRFVVEASAIQQSGEWRPCSGRLRVKVKGKGPDLARGDHIEVVGILRDLPGPGNPGQFDFGDHLSKLGIVKILSTPSWENIRRIRRGTAGPVRFLETLRNALSRALKRALPDEDGGLLAALLLGDQSLLTPAHRAAFTRSGTVHLLAVSGLHLMLVISALFLILKVLGIHGFWRSAALIAFAWFFAGLTGGRTPVLRAAIMTSLYFGADLFGREKDGWNALTVSAAILLLFRPLDLFSPGFQLSFAAVIGIITFARPLANVLVKEEKLVLELSRIPADRFRARAAHLAGLSVSVSLAAWVATAPLALYHFHILTPVVPLANLVAAPLTGALLAVGFLSLPWMFLFPSFPLFSVPSGALARLLSESARFFAGLPFSHVFLPSPAPWRLAAGYALLLIIALRPRWPGPLRRLHWILPAAAAGFLFFYPAGGKAPVDLEMTVLDVGQGSSTVLRFPDGRVLVYDAGTKGEFDVGEWVVAPYLWSRGVRRIDLLVLSHADTDHISAVACLLERFPVTVAAVPQGFSERLGGLKIIEAFRRRGVSVHILHRDSRPPQRFEDVLEVLHPPLPVQGGPVLSTNNASLTLGIRFGSRRILLPGDLERSGLSVLASHLDHTDFDVILAPHHGSNEVEGNEPFARGRPGVVVMSCGWSFGVEDTASLYRRFGARVFQTCRVGAVTVRISPDGKIEAGGYRKDLEKNGGKK